MENDNDMNLNSETSPKKKQKAGLNAIRPDDYVGKSFKEMASGKKLSQTEMFERMFWSYIRKEDDEKKQQAIDYSSEIHLISKDLNNILNHFKGITEKAQETVLNVTSNADQTKKNLNLDLDTLKKKVEELEIRNAELEESNKKFYEVKSNLENTILKQNDTLINSDVELAESKSLLKERDQNIKEQDSMIKGLEKSNEKLERENAKLSEGLKNNESRIKSLEMSNSNLQSTLSTIDTLKKSEITAIDTKYQAIISNFEDQIKQFNHVKESELRELEKRIRTELDADKKMAIADMKLELAELKSKYADRKTLV